MNDKIGGVSRVVERFIALAAHRKGRIGLAVAAIGLAGAFVLGWIDMGFLKSMATEAME